MRRYTRRRALTALSGIGTALLAGCSSNTASTNDDAPGKSSAVTATGNWPMFQRSPERSGRHRGTGPTSPSQQWTSELDRPIREGPVVANGTLYCTTDENTLLAIDAENGTLDWQQSLKTVTGSPVITGSHVLVSGPALTAFTHDSSRAWTGDIEGEPVTSPLVANGTVYVGSSDTRLYALSLEDGSRKWRTVPANARITAPPAASGGWVYIPTGIGLLAHDRDGTREWDDLDATAPVSPAVYDGWVYAGRADGVVKAYDARSGETKWTRELTAGVAAAPAVSANGVYVSDLDRTLSGLDVRGGGVKWEKNLDAQPQRAAAVTKNALYIGVGDRIVAYTPTGGTERWSTPHTGAAGGAPAVANGALYVAGTQRLAMYE